jgi:hypothetical protein
MSAASASRSSLAGTLFSSAAEVSPTPGVGGVAALDATIAGDVAAAGAGSEVSADGSAVSSPRGAAERAGGAARSRASAISLSAAASLAEGNGMLTVVTGPSDLPIDNHSATIAATPTTLVATVARTVWRRRGPMRTGAASFDAASVAGAGVCSGGASVHAPGAVSPGGSVDS